MSQLLSLDAQRCGQERHATAEADGFGITVRLDGHPVQARRATDAIRIAWDSIGEYLKPAQRGGRSHGV